MNRDFNILIVDDDLDLRESLADFLNSQGYQVETIGTAIEAFQLYRQYVYDLVISDVVMSKIDGIELLKMIKSFDINAQVILVTGYSSIQGAVEAIKIGADDYFTKPFDLDKINKVVERLYQNKLLYEKNQKLKQQLHREQFPAIAGKSEKLHKTLEQVDSVADSDISVLVTGESGTGKELIAKAIHQKSSRSNEPFIPVNCAAIPQDLLESEFFGHEKGAFSGAINRKYGLFEVANQGTLFLDEIGEMPIELQAKLLRVVETGTVRRVGGTAEINVDVRFVCSTNRNLEEEIENGMFRKDLYFRLAGFEITLPPLRERKQDIPLIMEHFIRRKQCTMQFSESFIIALMMYDWPGNVRELENVIDRALLLSKGKPPKIIHLPVEIQKAHLARQEAEQLSEEQIETLQTVERKHILKIYEYCNHDKEKTAKLLDIGLKTLYRKLHSYQS